MLLRNRPQGVEYKPSRPLRQFKPHAERLVVKWVTISESRLLIVFDFLARDRFSPAWTLLPRLRSLPNTYNSSNDPTMSSADIDGT
jgi:hypothetical protein